MVEMWNCYISWIIAAQGDDLMKWKIRTPNSPYCHAQAWRARQWHGRGSALDDVQEFSQDVGEESKNEINTEILFAPTVLFGMHKFYILALERRGFLVIGA